MDQDKLLFSDGFDLFSIGLFPHDYSPLGEYHCVEPEGYRGHWTELTIHHSWRSSPGWLIGEEDKNKFLEHSAVRKGIPSILGTGDFGWKNYKAQVRIRLISNQGYAGIAVRLQNNQSYYLLCIDANQLKLNRIHFKETTTLSENHLPQGFNIEEWHSLALEVEEDNIRAYLDDKISFEIKDSLFDCGEIGLVATGPARFDDVSVFLCDEPDRLLFFGYRVERLSIAKAKTEKELDEIRESLPKPVLWRRMSLQKFSGGKSVRFGDLDGDGEIEILMAQNLKRLGSGDFGMISCLTAVKLGGEVLWQIGEPNPAHALLTADVPLQIHDVDGDGKAEVVMCKDYRIQILDGLNGKLKREAPTPKALPSHQWLKEDVFFKIMGDSICFADLSGKGKTDILIKDRYNHIWAYNNNLEILWSYECETGHYPFPFDIDKDGRDEIIVGSTLLDEDGKKIWNLEMDDHVDTIAIASLSGDPIILFAAGDAGLYAADLGGRVIFHENPGHMQELSIGKFRNDVEGLQFFTKTFWGYPGIIFLYDANLRRLLTMQGYPHGFSTFPVNWSGTGIELIFASPHPYRGGLYDGWGRKAVIMPEDGHPNLCYHPLNVTGDPRDELLCWDERELWIYTQSEPFKGDRIYSPERTPLYNFSNYRSEMSLPNWEIIA